jgi:hypothetical protein
MKKFSPDGRMTFTKRRTQRRGLSLLECYGKEARPRAWAAVEISTLA